MDKISEIYLEETNPANEVKGFTKSFQRKSKSKKEEDLNIKELLTFRRENKLVFGAKMTEKAFKNNTVSKVYASSNCDSMTLAKIRHYARLAGVEVIALDLDNGELAQKLGRPFLISMAFVRK